MNDVMILRRGGGNNLFAAIGVTFPAGVTACTCTGKNSGKRYTAKSGYNSWIFPIPEPDEWTVKISGVFNGAEASREHTVSITEEMQFAAISMTFELELIKDGVEQVAFTSELVSTSLEDGALRVMSTVFGNGSGSYYLTADLTGYAELYIDGYAYKVNEFSSEQAKVYIGTSYSEALDDAYVVLLPSDRAESRIDVSKLSGVHYIVISPYRIMINEDTGEYRNTDAVIYNMKLE